MRSFSIIGFIIALTIYPQTALATVVGSHVDNFRLLDHKGDSHELYYYRDAKAIAVLVHANACQAIDTDAFQTTANKFRASGVEFFMLNSADTRQSLDAHDISVLLDDTQLISAALNADTAGEVFVINPAQWSVVYAGSAQDLEPALTNILAGKQIEAPNVEVEGCANNLATARADISYSEDIAPILLDKCVSCHREGGIGPWAMSDYNMVLGFSPMIREVVRTKRMPPWHADPETGQWSNDRSLSADETKTLVHWIEAGAPRGEGIDPLMVAELDYPTWEVAEVLGEPDYVIELPATEIPASGVMDYIDVYVENPIGKDVWVQAAEVLPGDRTVLHHTISTYGERTFFDRLIGSISKKGALRHYAPGISNRPFPENTGVFLPADSAFEFQMHYTTTGLATVDQTKVGIWIYDEAPEHSMQSFFIQNHRIDIPAHAANHKEDKTTTVPKDALLYSLLPHAHYRGKAAEFTAIYPDGSQEVLLSVPNYDFNWQTAYEFKEPKFIPAGTKLVQTNWWDNSSRNQANPDPSIDVGWGDQSWEEMLFGEVTLRFLDEEEALDLKAKTTLAAQ